LNSSSVTSYEFGLFGIRTLVFDPKLYYYADDLVIYPKKFNYYLPQLRKTLNNYNYDRKKIILNAVKYLSLQFNYESVDISEVFKIDTQSVIFRLLNRVQRILGFNFLVNYFFYFNNVQIKAASLFKKLLQNDYDTILNIRLKKKFQNNEQTNKFQMVQKSILKILFINKQKKLYNIIDKIV